MANDDRWYTITVEADVTLLPTSESGREGGITSGYRPNHNFGSEKNAEMRMGQIEVVNDEWIEPGESKSVTIKFLMPEAYVIDLVPGKTWRIQEGGRLVGSGKVKKLISKKCTTG